MLSFPSRKARLVAGLPADFWFYDLRHTGHTLSTRSGATLKDTMVQAGQSSERAALIHQYSDDERRQEVAAGLDWLVRSEREKRRKIHLVVRRWCEVPESV